MSARPQASRRPAEPRAVSDGANLDGANLRGANLVRANLVRANLDWANLRRANLDGANLDGANLDGANLDGANLDGANLDGANLDGANLDGANLRRANLDGAKINWTSHALVAEILRRAADGDIERRKFAGLVLISRDWCWAEFLRMTSDPQLEIALDELAKWVTEDDGAPKVLVDRAAKIKAETPAVATSVEDKGDQINDKAT